MKDRYLVTGSTGFVGSWITRALVEKGEQVSIVIRNRRNNWRLTDIIDKVSVYECDLQSPHLSEVIDVIKPSVVFHLAAQGALPGSETTVTQLFDTNVKGLINLLESVKKYKIKRFINTGSSSEYGIKDKPMCERDMLVPINDYGVTKSAATLYCQKIGISDNVPTVTLRLFSPYGYQDDEKRLIPYVITQALQHRPILLSSKTNVRDFVYIADVINAYLTAVDATINPGEIINIGTGQQYSVYDIVNKIVHLTKSTSQIEWGKMPKQARQIEPKIWRADIAKAKHLLKWQPTYSLEQGLIETINYYKER